jgi:hypothetical protein
MRKVRQQTPQETSQEMNESTLAVQPRKTSQEVAASASAALAKATIEAKFVIALQRPRSVLNARAAILDACKRPRFAEGAWYNIPNRGEGFTIRFAEQALNAWKNVDVQSVTAWENEDQRLVRITVTDLEQNLSYADEVLLNKTVERTRIKDGQHPISVRENSEGKKVFLVACTEDELLLKVNAAKSKVIRNSGLRLIPQDILEEAAEVIFATLKHGGEDTKSTVKKITDGFGSLGVSPSDLEEYLGHKLESCSPKEVQTLRSIFLSIKDGESAWGDFLKSESVGGFPKDDHEPAKQDPLKQPDATPKVSPQANLEAVITDAGFTFKDFHEWATSSKNFKDADSVSTFSEVPTETATRIVRAKDGLISQLKARKEGIA